MSGLSLVGLVLVLAYAKELTGGTPEGLGFLLIPMGVLFGLGLLFFVLGGIQYGTFATPKEYASQPDGPATR